MKCSICKTENKGDAYYCHNCGYQFKKKTNSWAIFFAAMFVIAGILAIYFYNESKTISTLKQDNKVLENKKTESITYAVTVNPTTLSLEIGTTVYLTYTITPQKNTTQNVTWSSNNPMVATVNSSGMVTAVAPGNAVITASIDNIGSNTCHVSIVPDIIDMLIIEASQRLLTENDLRGLTKEQLDIVRNGIFARHGYIFKRDDLRAFFSKKNWYRPQYSSVVDVSRMLNNYENKNVNFIKRHE